MDRRNYYYLIAKLQSNSLQDRELALNDLISYGDEVVGPVTRRK